MRLLAIVLLGFSLNAFADPKELKSGNDLLALMKQGDSYNFDWALSRGFIDGVIRGVILSSDYLCIPEGVTNGQIYDIITKYLTNNPEIRNKTPQYLIVKSLIEAYPCAPAAVSK